MTIASRVAAGLVLVAVLGACAGDDEETSGTSTAPPPDTGAVTAQADAGAAVRLTLTDDGCMYEGPATTGSGSFTAEVENQTEYFGAFAVAGLAGGTMADLESFIAESQQTFDETGTLPEPPAFYSQAVRTGIEAGQTGMLPVDVPPGTYALTCFVDDLPTWRGYVAGELVVSG